MRQIFKRHQFPKGGLLGRAVHAGETISQMHIPLHAAYTAYFLILSMFPALLLLLSILRYTNLQVQVLIELMADFLPEALMGTMENVIYSIYFNASGAVVGITAVTGLWSASRGIYGLLQGLNSIYGVSENRGYLYTRGISMVYTFFFLVVLLLTLVLHVFGGTLLGMLTMVDNPVVIFLVDLIDLRFFLLLILQSGIFTAMFMALPNKRNRFVDSLPGGVLASLGWLVYSDLFSIYMENFSNYSNIYGSIYAVALGMLWLYCCISILFYGGVLNRILMEWDGWPAKAEN